MTKPAPTPLYNEFTFFLKKYFPYKVQKISLNAGLHVLTGTERRDWEAVRTVITKHSIPSIVKRRNPSPSNLRKESNSLPINIRI